MTRPYIAKFSKIAISSKEVLERIEPIFARAGATFKGTVRDLKAGADGGLCPTFESFDADASCSQYGPLSCSITNTDSPVASLAPIGVWQHGGLLERARGDEVVRALRAGDVRGYENPILLVLREDLISHEELMTLDLPEHALTTSAAAYSILTWLHASE